MKSIKEIRIQALFTQAEFAKELNVSISTVQTWEQHNKVPSLRYQRKILEFCKQHNIEV